MSFENLKLGKKVGGKAGRVAYNYQHYMHTLIIQFGCDTDLLTVVMVLFYAQMSLVSIECINFTKLSQTFQGNASMLPLDLLKILFIPASICSRPPGPTLVLGVLKIVFIWETFAIPYHSCFIVNNGGNEIERQLLGQFQC